MSASWVKDCIWWHVYPLGFTDAPIREAADEAPRLRQLIDWLDYLLQLGANGLLLGPIFASSTHGYDSVDQFRIDPRLGTEQDFTDLVAACHERGIRVCLDGVFNHVGTEHPWYQQALAEGPGGEYADFFGLSWDESGAPTSDVFEGHASLVALNHANEQVKDYVADVCDYWNQRGVDAWRLDAAYAVPTEFWAAVLPRVRRRFPDTWFLGEVIHGDYGSFAKASTIDSITQYELWKAIWSSLVDQNYWELDASLQRNNVFMDSELPATFIGNHDVTRIATRVGDRDAFLAFVVLMTVGGVPSVYYGDEQLVHGLKREAVDGDDDIRQPMPAPPAELLAENSPFFAHYRELIALRRRHPWLVEARTETLELDNHRITYVVRAAAEIAETSGPDSDSSGDAAADDAATEDLEPSAAESLTVALDLTAKTATITDGSGRLLFAYEAPDEPV